MNSNSKTLMGVVLVSAALFAGWALLGGQYRKINVLKAAITERDGIIAEREGVMKSVDSLYATYQQRQQDVDRFGKVVPDKSDVASLISSIDAISANAGLQLVGISVQGGGVDKDASGTLLIPVQLLGNYESFNAFLEGIEKNLRLLNVTSIGISPDPVNPQLLNFDVQLSAYVVK